jgi:hypothetical protein
LSARNGKSGSTAAPRRLFERSTGDDEMKKKGNVLNANTTTIKENSQIDPVTYRAGAPAVRRRLPRGPGHSEDHPGSPRTLTRDPRKPWQKKGGNPDTNRTLRKLPCSIAYDAVD